MVPGQVSVIIPVYNVTKYLSETIQSVLTQDYPNTQIVVVNDGSGKNEAEEIVKICSAHPGMILVHQKNLGQAPARYKGLTISSGEYIIFLDGDDILLPGSISYFVDALKKNPNAIATYGRKALIDSDGNLFNSLIQPELEKIVSGNILPALLKGVNLLSPSSVCSRRINIEKVDFNIPRRQGEDWVMWCRLATQGDIIYVGDKLVLALRQHGENISSKALKRPSLLFDMLNDVFNDKQISEGIDPLDLETYRLQHIRVLHSYLRNMYFAKGKRIRSLYHRYKLFVSPESARKKLRVTHFVSRFYAGGAERLLSALLEHSDREKIEHHIISLTDQGERMREVQSLDGVKYTAFSCVSGKKNIGTYFKILYFLALTRPHVVKTWIHPSNIIGGSLAYLLRTPVIWGFHTIFIPKWKASKVNWYLRLSRFIPFQIVCCSEAVKELWQSAKTGSGNLLVIDNGTDTQKFSFKMRGRVRVRKELGIADDTILIGMAAEFASFKRHAHFLAAGKELIKTNPKVKFLLCGFEITELNPILSNYISFLGMRDYVHLLGIRDDMPDIYSAMDINTLNSSLEAFGLAVTEGMSCQTFCVATDVGIIKKLLDGVGIVYPASDDIRHLVSAWKKAISIPQKEKNDKLKLARDRIVERYSIKETARKYDELYFSTANRSPRNLINS